MAQLAPPPTLPSLSRMRHCTVIAPLTTDTSVGVAKEQVPAVVRVLAVQVPGVAEMGAPLLTVQVEVMESPLESVALAVHSNRNLSMSLLYANVPGFRATPVHTGMSTTKMYS